MLSNKNVTGLPEVAASPSPISRAIHALHAETERPERRRTRGINAQPLEAATLPGALLKMQTVVCVTGLSSATIYRKLAAGEFVEPIRLGTRCTRFRAGDVMRWLEAQGSSAAV